MYGSFLRQVRESRRLSQLELAEITGIPQSSLSAYEHDRRSPTIETLNRILVGCGYALEAVAGRERVRCPIPRAGWFADDPWRPEDDEPGMGSEPPAIGLDVDPMERAAYVEAVLALGDAIREAKALR